MKNLAFIITLFITVLSNAQVHTVQALDAIPMTTTQMNALVSPPEGRQIYNTTTKSPWTFNGTTWEEVGAIGAGSVSSVNGQTGDVVLDPDDLDDTSTTNKFITPSLLAKLSGIEAGAEVNVPSDWDAVSGDARILNKPTLGDMAAKDNVSNTDIVGGGLNGQVLTTDGAGAVTWANPAGGGSSDAEDITVDASGFDGNLDIGDTDVQAALQKLDDLNINLGGGIVAEGTANTSAGTTVYTVTHSLGYAPAITRIQVQTTTNGGIVTNAPAIENITTTTFDIRSTSNTGFVYAWRIFGTGSETPLDFGEVASGLDTELGSSDWRTGGSIADGSISTAKLADNAVTSTKILDGTILNADINASAGIAGTKIAITPFGTIGSTNVQDGMEEMEDEIIANSVSISANASSIADNGAAITAMQEVPISAFVTNTKTANYTFIEDDAKDDRIIYLDYDNETATIPADVFTAGNTIRIKNGTSGLANIVAGASVTFPTVTLYKPNQSITIKMVSSNVWQVEDGVSLSEVKWIPMVLSAVDGDLTVGTNKAVFHIPFAAIVVGVKAGVSTAGTGSTIIIDINEAGTSILSTKLTIDASETHTSTAATAAVISDANLAADAKISADIDQIGSSTAGKGAIAYLGVIQL